MDDRLSDRLRDLRDNLLEVPSDVAARLIAEAADRLDELDPPRDEVRAETNEHKDAELVAKGWRYDETRRGFVRVDTKAR